MKTLFTVPQRVQHGLLLMTDLAERYDSGTPMSLEEVAKKENISQGFLEEIAALLRTAGIIHGRRGAKGGYVLMRHPADVTVADIIAAIEGQRWTEYCLGEAEGAGAVRDHDVWRKVQGQVMATLYNMTLAEAACSKTKHKEPGNA